MLNADIQNASTEDFRTAYKELQIDWLQMMPLFTKRDFNIEVKTLLEDLGLEQSPKFWVICAQYIVLDKIVEFEEWKDGEEELPFDHEYGWRG
jgi:hypothetical protein